MKDQSEIDHNRHQLVSAQKHGPLATLGVYVRLSGPGWLQSAITLGGGSLAGALFLGALGGTHLLWLQLVAITMGVIMLSAISYVTLSTGQRPFPAIAQHINPVLAWGWLIATMMANMIWCMPQFSLCYASLNENLVGSAMSDSFANKLWVSAVLLVVCYGVVHMSLKGGLGRKLFDLVLKALVGMIVICFFGVVVLLVSQGTMQWQSILSGFVPDLTAMFRPIGKLAELVGHLSPSHAEFWSARIVKEQRAVMIGAAATAVGINMTFLLPYSMLTRGWDKPFRGLARFDLATGMAIPYLIVTSCVVIASAATFHGQELDDKLASSQPDVMVSSPMFKSVEKSLAARISHEVGSEAYANLSRDQQLAAMATLDTTEKQIALTLVQRDAFQLSKSLSPLLGEKLASIIFGLGAFGMGVSTIIILMLINGYALCEAFDHPQGTQPTFTIGCLLAGVSGASWPQVWDGPSKLWLAILASSFCMLLLPIAYITFMMMMNSRSLLKEEKPVGASMWIWNILMAASVLGAIAAATTVLIDKSSDPTAGTVVLAVTAGFIVAVLIGFAVRLGKQR
ncbi:MAG: divalent metal cation transporter [Pirellulaceae bacterium]|nr:divalent metal cation transporter [Pirellulaceae bacterium]